MRRVLLDGRMLAIFLHLLLLPYLLGCQSGSGAIPAQPSPTTPPTAAELKRLLAMIPREWGDIHAPVGFGPAIYFLDYRQMRRDLGVTVAANEMTPEQKAALQRGLNTQHLEWAVPNLGWEDWGWDMDDVEQFLLLVNFQTWILQGNFRPAVGERLTEKGYNRTQSVGFSIFRKDGATYQFAVSADLLIVAPAEGDQSMPFATMVARAANPEPGLESHPAVQPLLERLQGVWGAVLTPSPDVVGFAQERVQGLALPDEYDKFIQEWFVDAQVEPYGWEFMTITFKGAGDMTALQFLYYYPSAAQAQQDVELAKQSLTETSLPRYRGRILADYMTLQDVAVQDTILVAQGQTPSKVLLGDLLQGFDYWGFMLVRHKGDL